MMPDQICPSCGATINAPQHSCPTCGAALLAPPALVSSIAQIETPTAPRGERRLFWTLFASIGCLSLLFLVSSVGLLLFMLFGRSAFGHELPPTLVPVSTMVALADAPPVAEPNTASDVLIYDDFSRPQRSVLTAEEDEISRAVFEDDAYLIEVKKTNTLAWALTEGIYDDAIIEVDASIDSGADVVAAGLIFHYQDGRNFYLFSVANDGYYALEMLKDDEWRTLIDWTPSDVIKSTHNTLCVETKGNRITLKANGEILESTEDDSFSKGDIGLAVSSFDVSQVAIRFDNLLITRSP
ncbi:MAG: hypothetical protein HGA19_08775 [Oscillochloris sp.]|nr:hypothetical protein [Oscillochloris sp.]